MTATLRAGGRMRGDGPAAQPPVHGSTRRAGVLARLGIAPALPVRVHAVLDAALREVETPDGSPPLVLDAGCGRKSPLRPFRHRIGRLVGVDVHVPDPVPPYLDAFEAVDLCRRGVPVPGGTPFALVLSNFTVEHFPDPPAALANLAGWLRPGGVLVITTVNRRHPFVAGYLGMDDRLRRRLQPMLKASPADAHALVGACNTPALIHDALTAAGLTAVEIETLSNLGRSWGRHVPSFMAGLLGDVVTHRMPGRRATILAVARRPRGDPDDPP